MKVQY